MSAQELALALENYRCGVAEILPNYISGRYVDLEALTDEIALVLDSRDTLAEALAESFRLMPSLLDQIDRLDQQLLKIKDDLLQMAPAYTVFRRQTRPPRNHWWYYLDEIVASPHLQPVGSSLKGYWLPLTPTPTSASH